MYPSASFFHAPKNTKGFLIHCNIPVADIGINPMKTVGCIFKRCQRKKQMKCCNLHPPSLKSYFPRTLQAKPASCIHPFFQAHYIRPWKLRICGHSSPCSQSSWPTTWRGRDLSHTSPQHPVSGLKLEPDLPTVLPPCSWKWQPPLPKTFHSPFTLTVLPAPRPSWTTGLWISLTTLVTPLTI